MICFNSTDHWVAAVFGISAYWQVILHRLIVFEQSCPSGIDNGAIAPGLQLTGLNSAVVSAAAEVEWRSVNVGTGLERANRHLPVRRRCPVEHQDLVSGRGRFRSARGEIAGSERRIQSAALVIVALIAAAE